ncbi:MAG: glycosyl transferase family 1, partial [Phycisphaera sp.]
TPGSASRATGEGKPAVVHTVHGPPFHRYLPKWKNAIYIVSERFAAKRCHVITSVADAMTGQFRAANIGKDEQFVTVRSGMETEEFLNPIESETREAMRAELGFGDDDFVIGTVARLAQHKGHDDLLDALTSDLKSNQNWKLLWVGDGWLKDRLLAKAQAMGVRGQLILTGLVPPERVPGFVRAMDILSHPSYREGLPRTVPQALLCGVCPVAYDVDGTKEACRHEETGLLVTKGDIAGLREAVRRLYDDRALRTRLAAHGQAWCKDEFAADTMVRRLEDVYRGAMVLASGGGCAGGAC